MRAYERLLEYVKVKTPSSEENMETPSSSCQFELAERLVGDCLLYTSPSPRDCS